MSLLVIDIDHFKQVNDVHGHLQGDRVLVEIAELLCKNLRAADTAGRYAGDEMVALLPQTHAEGAREVAERLCAAVRTHPFGVRESDQALALSVSVGVATAPEHGLDADSLFAAADRALYRVKRQGRDGVAIASPAGGEPTHVPLGVERFVGREDELRTLIKLADDAMEGRPSVIALSGEAGVGKTTLIRQLEPEVRLRAGSLVVGRGHEADVQPPYAPWAEVITAIQRAAPPAHRVWHELPNLVPALRGTAAGSSRVGSKYVLLEEIAAYVREAARERLLVVLLDDVQWADSASWDMLEFLVPQLERERLLICLTIRGEETHGETLERRRRLSRNDRFRELTLSRLSREELRQWMQAAFHRQDISRELMAFIYHHTEGNPLFVVQVMRALLEEGAIWHSGERWEWKTVSELRLPVAVTDLMSRRLARLSPQSRRILTSASVVGREFDLDLAIEAGFGTEDELLDAIDEGMRAAVLQQSPQRGADRYAFSHVKMAEVLRGSVNSRRLRRLHQQIAEAMTRRTPEAIAEIATHFDRGGVAAKAYDYALQAADRARSVYAHQESTDFLRIAERNAGSPAQLATVRERRAEVAEAVGRYDEAEEMCDLAIEWFSGQEDHRRTLALRRIRERIRAALGQPAALTLEQLLALDGEASARGLDDERVLLLTMLAQTRMRLGDRPAAQRIARECAHIAERLGDPLRLAESVNRLGVVLQPDDPEEAGRHHGAALAIFERIGDVIGQSRCHTNLGIVHSLMGRWERARDAYGKALALARSAGAPDQIGVVAINLGVAHLKCGDHDPARERFGEALAIFSALRGTERRLYALYNLAHLERERGAHEAARELYEIALALAQEIGQSDVETGALAGAGLSQLEQGLIVEAGTSLARVERALQSREGWFQGRELAEALRVRVLAARAHEGALQAYAAAIALAEPHDVYGAAWLTAECAHVLFERDPSLAREAVRRFAERADALGFHAMRARFAQALSREERPGALRTS